MPAPSSRCVRTGEPENAEKPEGVGWHRPGSHVGRERVDGTP
jgi:hypothetical protein